MLEALLTISLFNLFIICLKLSLALSACSLIIYALGLICMLGLSAIGILPSPWKNKHSQSY